MNDERVIRTLRAQAWCRAKGELESILETYWDGHGKDANFNRMKEEVDKFVKVVEDDGLAE